jgi:hypothetical protein
MQQKTRNILFTLVIGLAFVGLFTLSKVAAAADEGEFSLQVSPSPLVMTLKPSETKTIDLKIRNTGPHAEKLKIATRGFTVDKNNGELKFDDGDKSEVASWVSFNASNFTVQPGQWYSEKVTFSVPKDAGFSYSFAFVINRQDISESTDPGRQLKGTVAVFSLINIDRPGAVRQLQVASFKSNESLYEYLPAKLSIELKNTGNTIVQPAGNVFIQRGPDDKEPTSVLPVNKNNGYILPGSVRTLAVDWDDGFQVLRPATNGGTTEEQLTWNWGNLSHLRIGRYTAKLVAVYNDGTRDVPIVGEISFWVFPWKLLLGLLVVLALIFVGLWTSIKRLSRLTKRRKRIRF